MASTKEFVLDGDVVAPREKKQRYRIYRVKDGGAPELVATCRTQGSVGVTLCSLGAEDEFLDCCVGLLDSMDHKDSKGEWVGKWLLLPWFSKEMEERMRAAAPNADVVDTAQ